MVPNSNLTFIGTYTCYDEFEIIPGETYYIKTTSDQFYPVAVTVVNLRTLEGRVMCYASWEKFLENWRIE